MRDRRDCSRWWPFRGDVGTFAQPVTGAASSVTPTPRSRGLADGDGRLDTAAAGLSNSRHWVLAAQRAAASNAQTLGQVPSPCQQRSRP